ncbi:hypothetical protein NDU88_002891 [Pleurodeles waltl]|uniref:Uncharacterized protein n=1 Tax=Pleurodeles waltl TaxID=8319 RepID=A0AAV7W0L3_PLEWA|nr:hypothetical protein NDU88_002891 [Pleurodeles waltl]
MLPPRCVDSYTSHAPEVSTITGEHAKVDELHLDVEGVITEKEDDLCVFSIQEDVESVGSDGVGKSSHLDNKSLEPSDVHWGYNEDQVEGKGDVQG